MKKTIKLLRTIALDPSDTFVFDVPAMPGESAVSGAFRFCGQDPAELRRKERLPRRWRSPLRVAMETNCGGGALALGLNWAESTRDAVIEMPFDRATAWALLSYMYTGSLFEAALRARQGWEVDPTTLSFKEGDELLTLLTCRGPVPKRPRRYVTRRG